MSYNSKGILITHIVIVEAYILSTAVITTVLFNKCDNLKFQFLVCYAVNKLDGEFFRVSLRRMFDR